MTDAESYFPPGTPEHAQCVDNLVAQLRSLCEGRPVRGLPREHIVVRGALPSGRFRGIIGVAEVFSMAAITELVEPVREVPT